MNNCANCHSFVSFAAGEARRATRSRVWLTAALLALVMWWPLVRTQAEECQSGSEIEAGARSALESAAGNYYRMSAAGDFAALRAGAIPSLQSDFSGIERAVSDNKDSLAGAQASPRGVYLLSAPGSAPITRAEFFCGIFNSPDRIVFLLQNLPPGTYAVVIEDVKGGKSPVTFSLVLQQQAGQWKLGGLYIRPAGIAGHNGSWYLDQARLYKAAGKSYDAWLYYLVSEDLLAPVPFMSTPQLDKILEETQPIRPSELPSADAPLALTAGGKTYRVTEMFATSADDALDLVVKYKAADISNTAQTYADNVAVIKALVAHIPQLREAFGGVVARAVAPSGAEYGSLLPMNQVK